MRRRPLLLAVALLAATTACGGGSSEPQAAAPVDEGIFTGEAPAIGGGTVDLGEFADQDLVVWFWSPW